MFIKKVKPISIKISIDEIFIFINHGSTKQVFNLGNSHKVQKKRKDTTSFSRNCIVLS